MKITAIHHRRKHLTAVEFDEKFLPEKPRLDPVGLLALDTDLCEEKFLKVGMELSEEQIVALFHESEARRAKSKALWLLSRRDHSSGELREKLRRDFPKDAVEAAVERCRELGLINDRAFAERLATQLIEVKGVSPKAAPNLMVAKGVDRSLAQEVLAEREDDPKDGIRKIIEKKYVGKLDDDKEKQRCMGFLMRRGFSYGDIRAVLREYCDGADEY